MAAPKRRSRPPQPSRGGGSGARAHPQVTVRMYNVGFGDCFLVTIPTTEGARRMLFDCGSVAQAPTVTMAAVLEQLWHDATDPGADAPQIDVIVATHRHRDHVSGFAQPGWERVQGREVWLPWTEHPTDPEARRIRETQSRLALALDTSLETKLRTEGLSATDRTRFAGWRELTLNALSN